MCDDFHRLNISLGFYGHFIESAGSVLSHLCEINFHFWLFLLVNNLYGLISAPKIGCLEILSCRIIQRVVLFFCYLEIFYFDFFIA